MSPSGYGMNRGAVLAVVATTLCLCASFAAASAAKRRRPPFIAFAQPSMSSLSQGDMAPAMPQHARPGKSISKVELKPDLKAKGFSAQNAYFFAEMSKIAYLPQAEARDAIKGNDTKPGLGFDHFYWFEADQAVAAQSLFDSIQDTEAFVAANDDMIMIAYRGTKEFADWATNLRAGKKGCPTEWGGPDGGELHRGFDDGVSTVWTTRGMGTAIKKLYNEEGKNRKLYITGHSLGAALATITAARLAFVEGMNITAMYTIGSPRVFDDRVAEYFDCQLNYGTLLKDKYFRCCNNNDAVTRVPPLWPIVTGDYKHVGTEIYIDRLGIINKANFMDQFLDRIISLLRGDFVDGFSDHATSEYIRLLKQIVTNSKVSVMDKATTAVMDAVMVAVQKIAPEAVQSVGPLKDVKTRQEEIEKIKEVAKEEAAKENCTGKVRESDAESHTQIN